MDPVGPDITTSLFDGCDTNKAMTVAVFVFQPDSYDEIGPLLDKLTPMAKGARVYGGIVPKCTISGIENAVR
jgi:hypothetical protein